MTERADADAVARQLEELRTKLSQLETQVLSLQESVQTAVVSMMPKVEELLSRSNASTSVSIASGVTPRTVSSPSLLELAEQDDHEAILRFLCEEQTNVQLIHQRTAQGDSSLHVAATKGNLKAVMALLLVIKVDDVGYLLRTPLHCAAAHGHLRVAQRLLVAGAQVDARDAEGKAAMALTSDAVMIELLIRNSARPATALQAVPMSHTETMELFQQKGISVAVAKSTLLLEAARGGHWDAVEFLLERGVSATKCIDPKECALVLAARNGQADAVRLLLRRGVASEAEQVKNGLGAAKDAAVVWAFYEIVPDCVRGEAGRMGLLEAARGGRLEALQALLDSGVDVNCRDGNGATSLHLAVSNGHVATLRDLLLRGADIEAKYKSDYTPLHDAARFSNAECVRVLVGAGASKTAVDIHGYTPIQHSSNEAIRNVLNSK